MMAQHELEESAMTGKPGEQLLSASHVTSLLELVQLTTMFLAGVIFGVGTLQAFSSSSTSSMSHFVEGAAAFLFSLTLRAEIRSRRGEGSRRSVNVLAAMTIAATAVYVCLILFLPES